jgi:carboxypeptidase Q
MRIKPFLLVIILFSAPIFLAAQSSATSDPSPVSSETRDAARQLIGDSIMNGKAYEYDGHLADMIGPRLTGSPNYMRAAEWLVEQFKALGLSDVHTEDWTIPATWEPDGPATGQLVKPVEHRLHIYSLGWSPSTPPGGISGEVIYVPSFLPDALDTQKAKLAGAIALVDHSSFGEHASIDKILAGFEHLRSLSPSAIVMVGIANGAESLTAPTAAGELSAIPEAQIGLEDFLLIKRLLDRGPVSMQFSFANRIRKDVKVPNVVAEIPGRELPNEVVIVGAHLDSWQPGTGAQDNGTGVASVLEVARAIKSLNRPPSRTIRFVLFGGEEEGLLGSAAYVRQHMADLPKIDAVLITDTGSGAATGWMLMGRDDEKDSLTPLKALLSGLGADGTTPDPDHIFSSDHGPFDVFGVPTLVLWNDMEKYPALHHKASDTFDSVIAKDLTQDAAVIAVTSYAIADSKTSFAAHLSPTEVQTMLQKAGQLDSYNYLKKIGDLP